MSDKSRNPINRVTNEPVTRSKDEAIAQLKTWLEQVKASDYPDHEFKRLATIKSECLSAKNGGDLEAAFALEVGEFSDLVETESGIHIIYRIA